MPRPQKFDVIRNVAFTKEMWQSIQAIAASDDSGEQTASTVIRRAVADYIKKVSRRKGAIK